MKRVGVSWLTGLREAAVTRSHHLLQEHQATAHEAFHQLLRLIIISVSSLLFIRNISLTFILFFIIFLSDILYTKLNMTFHLNINY